MLMENPFSSEPEEEVFGNIVELIATLSETSEDVQKILNDLLATDWDVILAHNLHYSQKAHEAYFHDWYCACCFEHFPRSQMSKIRGWNENFHYCAACQEQIRQENSYTCSVCQFRYVSMKSPGERTPLCYDCRDESKVVKSNLERAVAFSLLATLTLHEWITALGYFNWKCAYCQEGKYEVLEHFIPLRHGGGTTAGNCIPSCNACNIKKGNKRPTSLASLFSSESLSRIQEYLFRAGSKVSSVRFKGAFLPGLLPIAGSGDGARRFWIKSLPHNVAW